MIDLRPWIRGTTRGALLAVILVTARSGWANDSAEAHRLVAVGEYDEAIEILETLAAQSDVNRVHYGRLLIQLGRFEQAEDALRPLTRGRRMFSEGLIGYAELLLHRGQLEESVRLLGVALERGRTRPLRATWIQAEAFDRLGQRGRAQSNYEDLVVALDSGQAETAEVLSWCADALSWLGEVERANATYAQAVALEPNTIAARVGWAQLFLERHRPDQARALAEEILAINPRQPDAKVILAETLLGLERDAMAAADYAQQALEVNPLMPAAYELLARVAIDGEEYSRAIEILGGPLQVNPARLESLALTAAAHYLLDEHSAFDRIERRVNRINPTYAPFYATVAEFATHVFRYDEALALYQTAIDRDGSYWPAYAGLGVGLTRQGRDHEGLEALRVALEHDPFNERVFNIVTLYDRVLPHYEQSESAHFRYRLHRDEAAVLGGYLSELAEHTYAAYSQRYAVEPDHPLFIELFREPEEFANRSVGLPHVAPHGICFGRLVTGRSPNTGDFNWGEVVAHELSHAFTLALSDARIPRWLGEGVAHYDTSLLRTEWRREADMALLASTATDGLVSVEHLNQAFLRAPGADDLAEAYAQSAMTVEFIASEWGQEATIEMVRLFAERRHLNEVLVAVTGLEIAAFDARFSDHLDARLAPLRASFEPNPALFADESAYEARVAAAPESADAWAELAMAKFHALKIDDCRQAFEHALSLDPSNPLAGYLSAAFAVRERRFDDAFSGYRALVDQGLDGYSLRLALGDLTRRQGRTADAIEHYQRAKAIHPNGTASYLELADIYLRAGRQTDAITELAAVVQVDQNDFASVASLIRLLIAAERHDEAWNACQQGAHINPFSPDLHAACSRVAVALERWPAAEAELQLELALGPHDRQASEALLETVRERLPRPDPPDQREGSELDEPPPP